MAMITSRPAIWHLAERPLTLADTVRQIVGACDLGTSLFLIGAILRYAVTARVSGISLATVGLILMIVGGAGLVISLYYIVTRSPRRT